MRKFLEEFGTSLLFPVFILTLLGSIAVFAGVVIGCGFLVWNIWVAGYPISAVFLGVVLFVLVLGFMAWIDDYVIGHGAAP